MPWSYPNNVPNPAKNWSPSQQRRCVSAANGVLNEGGSDEEAIFACIHSAGKMEKQEDMDEYDELCSSASYEFQNHVSKYYEGLISLSALRSVMKQDLKDHYTSLMILGLNDKREPTSKDFAWLNDRLQKEYTYLEGFLSDIEERNNYSRDRALWRAGLYGFARAAYINFTIPPDVAELMPYLPGDDCLGGSLCKCSLSVEYEGNSVLVHWSIDPISESCPVCVAHSIESPYRFEYGDV